MPDPTPVDLWLEAVDRAGGLTAPAVRDLYHEVLDQGESVPEQRRIWTEIGRRLGLDAPPDDLFEQKPDAPELAAGPMPRRSEYPHERR